MTFDNLINVCRFANWPPHKEGKERLANEADHLIMVGGSFIKLGNLHTGLILSSCKVSRSPHQLSESLSLQSGLNWVQLYMLSGLSQQHCCLKAVSLKTVPTIFKGRVCILKTESGREAVLP